jgi:N-acetylneuraminate synthase
MSTFIIAEAGVNHNGSVELAKQLIDAAATAGADAIKFQSFKAGDLACASAPKAAYQLKSTSKKQSQIEMLQQLELSTADHLLLFDHAKKGGIQFLSTPFDSVSLALLTKELHLKTIKISSGDLTNAPFLLEIARVADFIILSTGMATLAEVEAALGVLAYGFLEPYAIPTLGVFERAYSSTKGQKALKKRVTLLHCTSEYPAPADDVNLNVLDTLRLAFGLGVGYSDHTKGTHISIAAVAKGAALIEKHITLDCTMPGPDHGASIEPNELLFMVKAIRDIELCLGDGIKRPTPNELNTRVAARRSLVVKGDHKMGEPLNISCKRPGSGISPFRYWEFSGTPASQAYQADELLNE